MGAAASTTSSGEGSEIAAAKSAAVKSAEKGHPSHEAPTQEVAVAVAISTFGAPSMVAEGLMVEHAAMAAHAKAVRAVVQPMVFSRVSVCMRE